MDIFTLTDMQSVARRQIVNLPKLFALQAITKTLTTTCTLTLDFMF